FAAPEDNGCPAHVEPNASGAWAELGPAGVGAARAAFAVALADRILVHVGALETAWSADGEDYGGALARPGEEGAPFDSAQEALQAVFHALFYVETRGKDRKLAWPLGERDCQGEDCADEVESPLAGGQGDWLAANVRGFRALFTGGDGAGF